MLWYQYDKQANERQVNYPVQYQIPKRNQDEIIITQNKNSWLNMIIPHL
jgi:hypothetical protein